MTDNLKKNLSGNIKNYDNINTLILLSFTILIGSLIYINTKCGIHFLHSFLSNFMVLSINVFLIGSLGSTIFCSLFFAKDKEINESEEHKEAPDPLILKYPNKYDVWLYLHRISTGGIIAFISLLVIKIGLLSIDNRGAAIERPYFPYLMAFLVGLHQVKFLSYLERFANNLIEKGKGVNEEDDSST